MSNNSLIIKVFGDICPIGGIKPLRVSFGADDYVVCNLECAITDSPNPIKKAGPVLYAPESFAATLKSWGIKAVSLANNHIRDCGDVGVRSTIDNCHKNNILTFGAGDSEKAAGVPLIIEENGIKVGVVSFAEKEFNYVHNGHAGALFFDPYNSFDKISELRQKVDAVVVLYHGGIEHYIYHSPLLRKKCRKMVSAGADVVLCQHSHCIGTREKYGKGEIVYGQGNSYFGYRKGNDIWNHGLLIRLEIMPAEIKVGYEVLETAEDGSVGMAPQDVSKRILSCLEQDSSKLSDDEFLAYSWKEFCRKKTASYLAMVLGFGTNANRLNRLFRNGLVRLLYSRRELNVIHNIIRCDSHVEVINTVLEDYDY